MDLVSIPAPHRCHLKHKASLSKEISAGMDASLMNISTGINHAQIIAQFLWSNSTSLAISFVSFLATCQIFIGTKIYLAEKNVIFRMSSSTGIPSINA